MVARTSRKNMQTAASAQAASLLGQAVRGAVPNPALVEWFWPKVEAEVLAYDGHRQRALFPVLDAEAFEESLRGLGKSARIAMLQDAMLIARGAANGDAGLEGAFADLKTEWNALSAFVRTNVDGGFAAWPRLRTAMFATFGKPNDPEAAILRINAYYARLTAARFPKQSFASPVHSEVKARLDRASQVLAANGQAGAANLIKKVGGFNIRRNVNDASKLSLHSFGWAIDVDWDFNPNIKKPQLPLEFIEAVTGVDLFGPESQRLRAPRPYADAIRDVEVMRKANDAYVAAFASVDAFAIAFRSVLTGKFAGRVDAAGMAQLEAFAAAGDKARMAALLAASGVTPAAKADTAATFLLKAIKLRKASAAANVRPGALGSAESVTRWGFFTMPPPFVAALVAREGAGLFWLGAANGTKDFMHFELFQADQPTLA
ncbi:hypothetical protein [Bosea sp. LjRoot237]|uniref:hypothetical protein n=1 Tax=Bosea sp. LjRoot237 TaxID=3342292 RepID=UPI003ECF74BE